MFTIYRLISPSGKSYIGLTSRKFRVRHNEHINSHKSHWVNRCKKLCCSFDKYPPETWTHEILYITDIKEEAEQKEIEFIEKFDSIKNGYNVLVGGNLGTRNIVISEQTREKLRNRPRKLNSPETREKISQSNKGRIVSVSTREKLRQANLGKIYGESTREKISLRLFGNKFAANYIRTKEHRDKISEGNKGLIRSGKTKEKIRQSKLGKTRTPFSDEWKRKIGESVKAHWINKTTGNLQDG